MDVSICNPLYFAEGVDISQPVVDMLNASYQRAGGIVPVSGTTTSNQK
jgi:hypothetical protein